MSTIEFNGANINLDEAGRIAEGLVEQIHGAGTADFESRVKLGTLLLAIKRTSPHGALGAFQTRHKIHGHTARSAMKIAGEFGGGDDGGPDYARMGDVRDAAVEAGTLPADHPIAKKAATSWTISDAERMSGVRPIPNTVKPPAFLDPDGADANVRTCADMGTGSGEQMCARAHISEPAGASGEQMGLAEVVYAEFEEVRSRFGQMKDGLETGTLVEVRGEVVRLLDSIDRWLETTNAPARAG